MKTQAEIDAIAARIRAAGTPDSLNRWLGMTPETLAESEDKVDRRVATDRHQRRSETMPRAIGPREQALRDLRGFKHAGEPASSEETDMAKRTKKAEATKAALAAKTTAAKKPTAGKRETTTRARTPVQGAGGGSAIRPGSKMAIIAGLLARPNGCTSEDVKTACDWPSVSMPQQAAALGVTLHKKKGEDGVTRYADHPL